MPAMLAQERDQQTNADAFRAPTTDAAPVLESLSWVRTQPTLTACTVSPYRLQFLRHHTRDLRALARMIPLQGTGTAAALGCAAAHDYSTTLMHGIRRVTPGCGSRLTRHAGAWTPHFASSYRPIRRSISTALRAQQQQPIESARDRRAEAYAATLPRGNIRTNHAGIGAFASGGQRTVRIRNAIRTILLCE